MSLKPSDTELLKAQQLKIQELRALIQVKDAALAMIARQSNQEVVQKAAVRALAEKETVIQ